MYGYEYPYANFHDINLDWVLGKTKECVEKAGNAEAKATSAKEVSVVAKQLALEATATAQNAATSAAAAQTAAESAQAAAAAAQAAAESAQASATAAAADATAAAGSVSSFDERLTAAENNANLAKVQAFNSKKAADDAQATADANTAAISGIQTKLGGIAKAYNIAVGTTWEAYTDGLVKQEIAVEGLVPGVVNLFDLDIPLELIKNAVALQMEWDKIAKKEAQSGKVILYAQTATDLPINIVLYVITNG